MNETMQINPYHEFISFLHRVCPDETVSQVTQTELTTAELPLNDSSISRSEQERIRDLSQIYLPPPTITPAQLLEIYRTIDTRFSIASLGAAGATPLFPGLGLMGTAILSTAIHEWAVSETNKAQIAKEESIQKTKNPLTPIIKKYIHADPHESLKDLKLLAKLATLPGLSAIFEGIAPSTLSDAYIIAEQQILSALLNQWIENEAKNAELQKKESKRKETKDRELQQMLLRQELLKALAGHTHTFGLSQPLFSIVAFGGILLYAKSQPNGSPIDLPPPGFNMFEVLSPLHFPEILVTEFSLFSQGIALTALTWAAPTAAALKRIENTELNPKDISSLSARSYCISLDKVLNDPAVMTFLQERIHTFVAKGSMTAQEAKVAMAAFKATLLLQATVALYLSETGGVTTEEIQALLKGTLTIDQDNLLATMARLVNLELKELSPRQQELFVNSTLEHIISSRSTHTITNPTNSFLSLWNPKYSQTVAMSCRS